VRFDGPFDGLFRHVVIGSATDMHSNVFNLDLWNRCFGDRSR
jgi:hypothetical protein